MAEDLIKIKDFPIIDSYENVNDEDRVVATHVQDSSRQTVAITIAAIAQKIASDAPNSAIVPRTYFGTENPSASDGKNGDMYFKLLSGVSSTTISASYIKINGQWVSFQVTDDNWRKFLEGQGFDVVSYDATTVKAFAFKDNTQINNVIMPNVTHVYESAFDSSTIKAATLPKCVFIDKKAFFQCNSWRSGNIDLPVIDEIGESAFDGVHPDASISLSINIQNVRKVGYRAFYETNFWKNRSPQNELYLPNCTEIGEQAFSSYGSSSYPPFFKKIDLPAIVTIGRQAFRCVTPGEGNTLEIHIGPNCTYIDEGMLFLGPSSSLYNTDIYVEAVNPPTLVDGFWHELGYDWIPTHLYVPQQSVDTYKNTSPWSLYASVTEAIPEEE